MLHKCLGNSLDQEKKKKEFFVLASNSLFIERDFIPYWRKDTLPHTKTHIL